MIRAVARFVLIPIAALYSMLSMAHAAAVPVIAAASDLQYALTEVAAAYAQASGRSVRLSFGSSGNFVRQIVQGAPFELFFSADEAYVRELARRGLAPDAGALYAVGRLALFVPKGSALKADAQLDDLAAALNDGRLKKLAIANPEHAPYGRAARAVLKKKGLWDQVQPHLVMGENVSQAAQFAASGSAEAGLIAYSLVISGRMAKAGAYVLLPADSHEPLRQRMVLLNAAGDTARQFYAFAQSPPARTLFEKYGFTLPAAGH
ncbi:MAG: molybdate ABC transporter substrate-binding protein [Burkholderiales bacterium]|nr:molybdate ABC transporter substrate-binding protein [Burkholderiales bacterium]